MHDSKLTPVRSKELGNGLAIFEAVGTCKNSVEALVVVHIGAGNLTSCLPSVQSMSLQQAVHTM